MGIRSTLQAAATVALFIAGAAAAATPAGALAPPPSFDAFVAMHMDEAGIAGMGAAIIVDGKLAWSKGFGYADKQARSPFTTDTVMNVGSVTKAFTGVAIMQAVQDGKLSLDADINDYLPFRVVNPHFPDARITLRQLATHTSGISDRWPVYRETYYYGDKAPPDLGGFLAGYLVAGGADYAPANYLAHRPGSFEEYSNIGAGLAGYIVERAVGQKLDSYTRERILAPLAMRNSGWSPSDIPPGAHSTLYIAQNTLTTPIPLYSATTYPDGGLRTSVADLSRFFVALLNDGALGDARILSKASATEMQRYQFDAAHKPGNIDLAEENAGIFWQTKFNGKRVGHGGSDPGVKAEMLASLSKDVGVILFSNTSLGEEDMGHYVAVLLELWKQAEAMKSQTASAPRG